MKRFIPIAAVLSVLAVFALRQLRREAPPPAAPAAAAPVAAAATRELPGGFVERAQALLPRGNTTVEAGTPAGTLLVTGLAAPGTDPVDAWRRPLHEMRELFVGLPGMLALEYDLKMGERTATLHVTRAIAEKMQLVQQLDRMHGQREGLLAERSAGTIDEASYAAKLRELERSTFRDMLITIPAAGRQIDPGLEIR